MADRLGLTVEEEGSVQISGFGGNNVPIAGKWVGRVHMGPLTDTMVAEFIIVEGLEHTIIGMGALNDFGYSINYKDGRLECVGQPNVGIPCRVVEAMPLNG